MNIRTLWRDFKGVLFGLWSIGRSATSHDQSCVAITLFSTQSAIVRPGEWSQYELLLANPTPHHCWVKLHIQIRLKEVRLSVLGPFVWLEKNIFVRSRDTQSVTFSYDWDEQATFQIDGVRLPPDRLRRGLVSAQAAYYAVTAGLSEDQGQWQNQHSQQDLETGQDVMLVQRLVV